MLIGYNVVKESAVSINTMLVMITITRSCNKHCLMLAPCTTNPDTPILDICDYQD